MSSKPRLVLVHGSVTGGAMTWGSQARALGERFELDIVERPGFPPNPPIERVDFEQEAPVLARRLRPGDHLVGHSYGGIVAMLAAAERPELLASLTLIEPPCTRVALGNTAADEFGAGGSWFWANGPDDPEAFLREFLVVIGSTWQPPAPLPRALDQGARALRTERGPWEAEIPVATIAAAEIPTLVVSGGHHEAFQAISAALVEAFHGEHVVLSGYGHAPHLHPDFNGILEAFVRRSA